MGNLPIAIDEVALVNPSPCLPHYFVDAKWISSEGAGWRLSWIGWGVCNGHEGLGSRRLERPANLCLPVDFVAGFLSPFLDGLLIRLTDAMHGCFFVLLCLPSKEGHQHGVVLRVVSGKFC